MTPATSLSGDELIPIVQSGDNKTATPSLLNAGNEVTSNKSNTIIADAASTTKYPSVKAIKDYTDSLVSGLIDYRGAYNASSDLYPATGGSGTGGAVMKGDMWVISVAGILGGVPIQVGDMIIAVVNSPGQTAVNWDSINTNLGYIPEDEANKVTSITGSSTDVQYPSAKLLYDQLLAKAPTDSPTFTGTIAYPAAFWSGGKIVYVPLTKTGKTQTQILNEAIVTALTGDMLILAAGTYTITASINVSKGIAIKGQGAYNTTINSSAASIYNIDITASNVSISDLSVNNTGAGSIGISISVQDLTNIKLQNIYSTSNILGSAGMKTGISIYGSSVDILNCRLNLISTDDQTIGIAILNGTGNTSDSVINIFDTEITVIGASVVDCLAIDIYNGNIAKYLYVNIHNCLAYAYSVGGIGFGLVVTSTTTNYIVVAATNSIFSGGARDILTTGTNVVSLQNSTLTHNTSLGTITYLGNSVAATFNGMTLSPETTGFEITAGVTPKTLTVPLDASVSGTNTGDQTLLSLGIDTVTVPAILNDVLKWNGSTWVPAVYNATFVFSVATFSDGQTTLQLIGAGVWKATGDLTFTATYNNGPPTSAHVVLTSDGGSSWGSDLVMTSPFATKASAADTNYPTDKDKYIQFAIHSAKNAETSNLSETAIYFRNYVRWGIATINSGFTESDVEALSDAAITNAFSTARAINSSTSQYIVIAYPASYASIPSGADYESDGDSGFLFNSIACAMKAAETVSITNSAGFTENYKVFASTTANIGNSTLVMSTGAISINPLYYGKTTKTATFLESDVKGLAANSITNDNTQVWAAVVTTVAEYMLFAFPKRLGVVAFWVGGFEGGFETAETVSITNANGWTEDYYAWRSTNSNLGSTIVETK